MRSVAGIALVMAGGAYLVNLMWRGKAANPELRDAVRDVLPPDLAKQFTSHLKALDAAGVAEGKVPTDGRLQVLAQEVEALSMVAAVMATRLSQSGDKSPAVLTLCGYLQDVEKEMAKMGKAQREAMEMRMLLIARAAELDADEVNDQVAADIRGYLGASVPGDKSQNVGDAPSQNSSGESSAGQASPRLSAEDATPGDTGGTPDVDVLAALDADPALEAQLASAVEASGGDLESFSRKAAMMGIPIGIAAAAAALLVKEGAFSKGGSLDPRQLWNRDNTPTEIGHSVTSIQLFPDSGAAASDDDAGRGYVW
jgi:hypothetical protein